MMMRTTLLKNRRERRAMYFQKKTFTLNTFAFKSINLKDDDDDDDHYDDDDGYDEGYDYDSDDETFSLRAHHSALALARIWGRPVDSEIYSTESAKNLTTLS